MPLTLILGPANSAKAGEVLGAYATAAHRGALLVVPNAADADHYARELAGDGAILGSVLTFSGLAREIARRAGFAAPTLSALQRERVLRLAVAAAPLDLLAESAGSAGFAAAVGRLISDLERSLVTPQRFAQAMSRWGAEDPRRERYAREVAALYRAYAGELERVGRLDADLFAWRALDALRAEPGRWGSGPVFLYGFDDLNALERDAVETLARVAAVEVTVSLSYEAARAAFAARAEAVEELRPLADRVRELPALDEYYAPASRRALHHLERSLFEPGAGRIDPGDAVRLFEAGGERAEAELIAAEVLALLRAGIPGEEIVIVSRTPDAASPVLERVCAQYGIPVALARRVRFADSALGRGVRALARCAWSDVAGASDVLAYLRTPGVLDRPEVADQLEFELRRAGLGSAEHALARCPVPLPEIDALRGTADPGAALAEQSRALFSAPHRGLAPALGVAEERDARALAALLVALDELAELGERPGPAELLELLDGLVPEAELPERPGAVQIADPLAIRARRFRAVFVCGLQEGAFPRPTVPDPFLSDERRRELARASGLRLAPSEDGVARERYLFYACVSRASEAVIFSYHSSDEEGNLQLRSPFLADVEELFAAGWAERRRKRLLADVVWGLGEAPTERERERSRAAAGAALAGEPATPERVLGAAALGHVRHAEIVSAGALESYADCPVKWLIERELSPARYEPNPDPIARGSYIHTVIEELIRRLDGPVTQDSLPRALAILDELLAELPAGVAAGRPEPVRTGARESIAADLRRYLEHEAQAGSGWRPHGVEIRFGFDDEGESLPALELGEGVRVRGLIDRVDVDPRCGERAIVRDYKSGRVRREWQGNQWGEGRQLQVALYMLAVRRLLGLDPVAGFYQPLGGGDMRPRGVYLRGAPVGERLFSYDARDRDELDEVLEDARVRAVELAVRLRGGELRPCPQTCSPDGCRYPGICRSQ